VKEVGRKRVGWVYGTGVSIAAVLAIAAAPVLAQVKEAPPAPRFEIQRFIVEGNTLIPESEVERLVAPFTGANRDFGDVQKALEALQDAYLERGYNAARVLIPEQDLRAGQVRLQVIEAKVRNVRVEENKFFDEANVRASVTSVRVGESPNTREISRNVQLVNENPVKNVGVRLEAADEPGKVDVALRVADDKPVKWTVSADDTGNIQTGRYRVGLGYLNANVANRDHVLNAQVITSPDHLNDVLIIGVGYRIPLYRWNSALDFVAGYSDVNSGTVGDLFTISGKGTILSARYSYILPRAGAYEQKLVASWDYRDFHQNVGFVGGGPGLVPDITIKPLGLSYLGRYSRVGYESSLYATYVQNIPGGADGNQDAFTAQRAGARASYRIVRMGAQATGAKGEFLLRAAFSLQHTNDALVPGEQFGMGGASSVRGYFEREVANDIGQRASFELYFPDMGKHMSGDWRARALVFVDAARGRDNDPVRAGKNGLASYGLGLRLGHAKNLSAGIDWAHVANDAGSKRSGDDRLHFSVAYTF
jgi:hemolysin activation/secretion protein